MALADVLSLNSDAASGKEMSDSYDGTISGGKGDGKPRKHHRKSARTRSRQEKTSKPKLSMLNVSALSFPIIGSVLMHSAYCLLPVSPPHVTRFVIRVIKWWNASWKPITTKW